jgi:TolB protein
MNLGGDRWVDKTMKMKILQRMGILAALFWLCAGCGGGPGEIPQSELPVSGIAFTVDNGQDRDIHLIQPDGTGRTVLISTEEVDSDPAFSPDGRTLAFRSRRDGSSEIFLVAADGTGEWLNLVNDHEESFDDEFSPAWHPSGELLAIFTDRFQPPIGNCRLQAGVHHLGFIALDVDRFEVDHFDDLAGEQESLGWSPDGETLAFGSICIEENVRIHLLDWETRKITVITEDAYASSSPAFSPDGRYLAFSSNRDGTIDIMLYDLETGQLTNLTQSEAKDRHPSWSPDSQWIAFTSDADGNDDIFIIRIDGTGLFNVTDSPGRDLLPSWSPAQPSQSP